MSLDAGVIVFTLINVALLCCVPFVIWKIVKFFNKQKVMEKEIAELKKEIRNR